MKSIAFFLLVLLVRLPAAPALETHQWTIDGVTREALIYLPPTAKTKPAPIIFAFHGHGGTSRFAANRFGYQNQWPDAITVYPQGLPTPGFYDPKGEKFGWQKTGGDQNDRDLKFFDAMLASLKKDYQIDDRRIYATGHSNGAGFTYLLWAARGDVFAAIAPVAGLPQRNLSALKPKPVMHVAGTEDTTVPFVMQKGAMELVRTLDQCAPIGQDWAPECLLYPSKVGAPFVSLIYQGDHKFPEEAPPLIVKFFQENVLPAG